MESEGQRLRTVARVLIIDERRRVLLLRDHRRAWPSWWSAPGGAVEPAETHVHAVLREVDEELGVHLPPQQLHGPVWQHRFMFTWRGAAELHEEQYFIAWIRGPVHVDASASREYRWWSMAEIAASSQRFLPELIAELLPPLLRGELPQLPIQVRSG